MEKSKDLLEVGNRMLDFYKLQDKRSEYKFWAMFFIAALSAATTLFNACEKQHITESQAKSQPLPKQ